MLGPILQGVIAALIVALPQLVVTRLFGEGWNVPAFILGITCLAMITQRFLLDPKPGSRSYDGIADVMIHIHNPASPDPAFRWTIRGLISWLLSAFTGLVGPEGAAVELNHSLTMAFRARSARWFEQKRRTDAASTLAAGISAAFGAPFAALLIPVELEIGGRSLSVAAAALSAYLSIHWMKAGLRLETLEVGGTLYGLKFFTIQDWLGAMSVGIMAGLVGVGVIRFIRYSQDSLLDLFQTQTWMRVLAGGILLFLVSMIYKAGHGSPINILQEVLWSKRSTNEVALLFFAKFLSLALVLSAFGTIGLFWPLFALGGAFGYCFHGYVLSHLTSFGSLMGLAGGAAFFGAVLGAPLAGGMLAFELTQNLNVLLPCLIASFFAREVRERLWTKPLWQLDLQARGISLVEGRSAAVLDTILVRDAMVTDHESVHEHEPVSALYTRVMKAKYPFLPVVNALGLYTGLLSIDMIQDGWESQSSHGTSANPNLSHLVEAKDLLYRAGTKTPTIRVNDRLTATAGIFSEYPCIAVIGDDGRVVGLLFVYHVRLAYDREVAKRSLKVQSPE